MMEKFRKLEHMAMNRILEAVKRNDLDRIARMTRAAQVCRDAQSQLMALEGSRDSVAADLDSARTKINGSSPRNAAPIGSGVVASVSGGIAEEHKRNRTSAKAKGKQMRKNWLLEQGAQGYPLRQVKGVVYETQMQRRVGIACATERPKTINKWFLGLPDEHYDVVVLLCEDDSREVLDFVLPADLISPIWNLLSRSGGQVKFHVERNGVNWVLRIPGTGSRSINLLRSNYGPLR